jgi:hypothetical protein
MAAVSVDAGMVMPDRQLHCASCTDRNASPDKSGWVSIFGYICSKLICGASEGLARFCQSPNSKPCCGPTHQKSVQRVLPCQRGLECRACTQAVRRSRAASNASSDRLSAERSSSRRRRTTNGFRDCFIAWVTEGALSMTRKFLRRVGSLDWPQYFPSVDDRSSAWSGLCRLELENWA